jgi:hypothetical protein
MTPASTARHRPLHQLACAALLCCTTGASAQQVASTTNQPWRVLVATDLSRTEVQLVALRDDGELVARERDGAGVRRPLREVLALLPIGDEAPPQLNAAQARSDGLLVLTSGAMLTGELQGATLDANPTAQHKLVWSSPTLGLIEASLDEIRSASRRSGSAPLPQSASEDVVRLANGDVRRGFAELSRAADASPVMRLEQDGKSVDIALSLLDDIALANPPQPPTGLWAWLDDGSVVPLRTAFLRPGGDIELHTHWAGNPSPGATAPPPPLAMDQARVLALAIDRARVRGLAECTIASDATDPQRRYTPPARIRTRGTMIAPLGSADIELPGPMRITIALPAGATAVVGTLELPVDCRTWGSVGVTISQGGREVAKATLDASAPSTDFRGALSGDAPLVILVDDAGDGGIEDTVLIRRALISLAPAP